MESEWEGTWKGSNNIQYDPMIDLGTFELRKGSPCIGRGVDSIETGGKWFYAPPFDINNNTRPYSMSDCVDLGAIESEYSGCFVAINEHLSPSEQMIIYPNPANNIITIEGISTEQYIIEMSSLNGQLICSTKSEGTTHHLDLSSFSKGVCFITIRTKDFVTTRKIIKM